MQVAKVRLKDNIVHDIDIALREGTVDIATRVTILLLVSLMCPVIIRAILLMTKLVTQHTISIIKSSSDYEPDKKIISDLHSATR